jgi:membrane protein DedA with SNARE-associated domain
MQRHAFLAMLFCRFVPAGRMAASAYAGRSGFGLRRFLRLDLAAATLWATYAALLGRFGGEALASSAWLPLAIVGAVAVLVVAAGPIASLVSKSRTH